MSEKPDNYEWINVFGNTIHRTEFYKLLFFGFLVLSVVLGSLGYLTWSYFFPARTVVTAADQVEAVEVMTEKVVDPRDVFFEQHFAATRYDEIESIRATGTYTSGDVEMELIFLAKNPHFYKQTLLYEQVKVEAGYDGEQLWYQQSHAVVDDSDEALTVLNRALSMLECAIPCLTWEYEKGPEAKENFQLMGDETWNGRHCLVVKNLGLLESPVYHYIDAETGLEVYRRSSVAIDARRRKDVELFYLPPLEGSEYALPGGFELHVDGVLYCTATFDQIEINRGLPDFLFEARE